MLNVSLKPGSTTIWSKEHPTTEGVYWFYGFPFGKDAASLDGYGPELMCVEVVRVSNGLMYISQGFSLEGDEGLWTPIVQPDLPMNHHF